MGRLCTVLLQPRSVCLYVGIRALTYVHLLHFITKAIHTEGKEETRGVKRGRNTKMEKRGRSKKRREEGKQQRKKRREEEVIR